MANRKYFGTDGVRGKVGTYPITPDFALKLGWAAGKFSLSRFSHGINRERYSYFRLYVGICT